MTTQANIRSGASDNRSFCLPHMLFRNKPILKICHSFENGAEFASEGVNSYRNVESRASRGTGSCGAHAPHPKSPEVC